MLQLEKLHEAELESWTGVPDKKNPEGADSEHVSNFQRQSPPMEIDDENKDMAAPPNDVSEHKKSFHVD